MHASKTSFLLLLFLLCSPASMAAVVNVQQQETLEDILSTISPRAARFLADDSPSLAAAVKSIDAATTDIAKTVAVAAPALSPVLTAGAVSYVAYVALSMAVPSTVRSLGLPSLDDFVSTGRSFQNAGSLMERLTTQMIKSVFSKTEFAGSLMSTAGRVITSSVTLIRAFTTLLRKGLEEFKHRTDSLVAAFNSGCLHRYMCKAGLVTRANFPIMGFLLKNIRSHLDDDFAHALIDGATTGECNTVFKDCVW